MDNDINARVRVLEEWRTEMREDIQHIIGELRNLTGIVSSQRLCNAPNTCIELRREVDELKRVDTNVMSRILALERAHVFLSGAAAVSKGSCSRKCTPVVVMRLTRHCDSGLRRGVKAGGSSLSPAAMPGTPEITLSPR